MRFNSVPLKSWNPSSWVTTNHLEGFVYIGELAKIAQEILIRRGEESSIDPGEFGKRLKFLGFSAEPRDAQGVQIHLTEAVSRRAKDLAGILGLPKFRKKHRRR